MTTDDPRPGVRVRLLRRVHDAAAGTVGEVYQRIGPPKDGANPGDLFTIKTQQGLVVVRRDEIEMDH